MNDFAHENPSDVSNLDLSLFDVPTDEKLTQYAQPEHKPRILLLYGSTRERSFSRLLTQEAARILTLMGAETAIFDPSGLPLPDDAPVDHPKVQELRDRVMWSEARSGAPLNATARCPPCSRPRSTGFPWRWERCVPRKARPWQ